MKPEKPAEYPILPFQDKETREQIEEILQIQKGELQRKKGDLPYGTDPHNFF